MRICLNCDRKYDDNVVMCPNCEKLTVFRPAENGMSQSFMETANQKPGSTILPGINEPSKKGNKTEAAETGNVTEAMSVIQKNQSELEKLPSETDVCGKCGYERRYHNNGVMEKGRTKFKCEFEEIDLNEDVGV